MSKRKWFPWTNKATRSVHNVGAGNYYFVFVKCVDGYTVKSDNVTMFSN